MSTHHCDHCAWRGKYDTNPRSLLGRAWRWHIKFCPGWKAYYAAQPEETRRTLAARYGLRPR